jgi:transposase
MQLTDFQKGEIVALRDSMSHREIGRQLDIPHRTVSSFLERYDQRKSADNLPHPGAPRKLSTADIRYLVRTVESETRVPLAEIPVNTTFSNVSVRTIRRRLREEGIRKWKAVGRTLLTPKDAKLRYKWAKAHRHWTREDWEKIVWSDESLIKQDSDPRQMWVFRHQNKREKYEPKNIRTKLKYGGVKQMVWACFCNNKLGPIAFINGSINSHVYISILQAKLLPFIQALREDGTTDIVFQQDNAKVHKSKLTNAWLADSGKQNGFSIIVWPAYSPDMNPIEELWAHLKIELHHRYPDTWSLQGSNDAIKQKLQQRLWEVWWEIGEDVLSGLIDSMPRRVEALIAARGWYTKY